MSGPHPLSFWPWLGDLVIVKDTNWYASKGPNELYQFSEHGLIRKDDLYSGRSFWGPNSKYCKDQTEYYSTSGGPFICAGYLIGLHWLRPTLNTFWKWQDLPRAGGGISYQREVDLWQAEYLNDPHQVEIDKYKRKEESA